MVVQPMIAVGRPATDLSMGDWMEHRWSKRYPTEVDVQLYQHGHQIAVCKARDIGIEGMFLDTGPLFYRANTLLDVEFRVEPSCRHNGQSSYRIPVIVIHNANHGIGLMMLKAEAEARYAWQQLMTQARQHVKEAVWG